MTRALLWAVSTRYTRLLPGGRSGTGPLCVIPTAAANAANGYQRTVETFDGFGGAGTATGVLIDSNLPETARDPNVVAQLRRCSGFYFVGGVQSRIVAAFRPNGERTPAFDALMERFRAGAVVAGSSAGAAIMSDPMIAGGNSAPALANGVRRASRTAAPRPASAPTGANADEEEDDVRGVSIAPGLGFLSGVLVDQHFLARGRVGRLIVAVMEMAEVDLGFGIDENTALVVEGDVAWPVGASGVVILDERGARRDGRTIDDLRLHLMSDGDRFDIRRRTLTLASAKTTLAASDAVVTPPADVFERWRFLHLLHEFARTGAAELLLPVEGGSIVLTKTSEFRARSATTPGVQNTPAGLSMSGLLLDLRR